MKFIKNIILPSLLFVGLLSSCVDDFQDANPDPPFDSPFFLLKADKVAILSDETVQLTLTVIDAPGKVEEVQISTTDDLGTIDIDSGSLTSTKGKEAGGILATFIPPTTAEGSITIRAVVLDAQGENQKSHTESVTIDVNHSCNGKDLSGTYQAITCVDSTTTVNVTSTANGFKVSDLTAGMYGADVGAEFSCESGVLTGSDFSQDTLSFSGLQGELAPNGSILINWVVNTPAGGDEECSTALEP